MPPMIAKYMIRVLLVMVTPKTAAALAKMLADLLYEMAAKTNTDIDDKLVELFKRFIKYQDDNGLHD